MPEGIPLEFIPGGKPNAIFVVTVKPGFMLWLRHDSNTEIMIE